MHFTDEQPFLDAIFDRYGDDRPRLVYADFLDDCGEPDRAELIRVQLALARLSDDDSRRPLLADRQVDLLARNRAAWTAHLAGLVVGVDFRRGIPDSVTVDAGTFLERGEELFARLRVRRLRLLDAAAVLPKLTASPLLDRVRELDLCGADLGNDGLRLLSASPHLKNLEALDLGFNGLSDAGVLALARASNLPNLCSLALNDNEGVTDAGFRALVESPFFAGLTVLDASGNDIGEVGVAALVTSPAMARLRALRLNNNHIGDAGLGALARSSLLARMLKADSRLEVRGNAVGQAGAEALAASPALVACTALDLSNNYLGDAGVAALLRAPHLGNLRVLRVARNQLTDAGVVANRELFEARFEHLQLLDASGNRLTRFGQTVLHDIKGPRPVRLELTDNLQPATAGDAPVAVSDLVPDLMEGVAAAARLRHRIANPRHRNDEG
jgi:uncharacterized protein (TIGR02996 family)